MICGGELAIVHRPQMRDCQEHNPNIEHDCVQEKSA